MFTPTIIAVIVVWTIASLAIPVLPMLELNSGLLSHYSNIMQVASSIIAASLCLLTMMVFKKGDPIGKIWGFLALGLLSWGIGSIVYAAYPFFHGGRETPYPWYSDFGYLGMVPFIVVALIIFKRTIKVPVPVWGMLAAIGVFCASLGLSIWSSLGNLEQANLRIEYAIAIAYIIFDPVLLGTTVLCASLLTGGQVAKPWWYGFAGLVLYYFGNVGYNLLVAEGTYQSGHWVDVSWPLAFGLIAVAAMLTRRMFKLLEQE